MWNTQVSGSYPVASSIVGYKVGSAVAGDLPDQEVQGSDYGFPHFVLLSDLPPGTLYSYRAKSSYTKTYSGAISEAISEWKTFTILSSGSPSVISCTDSDGGLDYYTKGTLKYTYGNSLEGYDLCDDNYVSEQACNSEWDYTQNRARPYNCPYGCSDGACLPAPPTSKGIDTQSLASVLNSIGDVFRQLQQLLK